MYRKRQREETNDGEREPPSSTLYRMIHNRPQDVWLFRRLQFTFNGTVKVCTVDSLNRCFQQWLSDIGQCMVSRIRTGAGVRSPCSLRDVQIVDRFVRLSNPSIDRKKNHYHVMEIVEDFTDLCLGFVNLKNVASKDMDHLLHCLQHINPDMKLVKVNSFVKLDRVPDVKSSDKVNPDVKSEKDPLQLFDALMSHFLFESDYTKLTFIEHSVRYLVEEGTKEDYKLFKWGQSYDIFQAIGDNLVLLEVYYFEVPPERRNGSSTQYPNTALAVLLFMSNFIKHANQHCMKLGIDCFTDQEKVTLLEHCFPSEMHNLWWFCWTRRMKTDRGQHLRLDGPGNR